MKRKLFLFLLACSLTAVGSFAQNNMKRPVDRKDRASFNPQLKAGITSQRLDSMIYYYESGYGHKIEYLYDNNGTVILEIDNQRDNKNSAWEPSYKRELTYDSNTNQITQMAYNWENNVWVKIADAGNYYSYKREYTYDSNGNPTMYVQCYWDDETNAWEEASYKREYTYDQNKKVTVSVDYEWNNETNAWETAWKDEYTYNTNGNMILWVEYRWDNGTDSWKANWKEECTPNGEEVQVTEYDWNNETNAWEAYFKGEVKLDLSVLVSDIIRPFYEDENIFRYSLNKPISMKGYEWSENGWQEDITYSLYYFGTPTGIQNVSTSSVSIYPNPVIDNFVINGIEENTLVTILDISGKIVLKQTVSPNEAIAVDHLSTGVYFVSMKGRTIKVIKK